MSTHLKPGEPASDNAAFDVHQTDPARLKKETRKDMGMVRSNKIIKYKGHKIDICDDIQKGIQFFIEGPRFNTPYYSAESFYDAEIKAKGTLDQVIR